MAGVAGLEPVTSAVTGQRSNQLSYTPAKGDVKLRNVVRNVKFCFGFFLIVTICHEIQKSGQQTPRRWGWGTPLKKRTATRIRQCYSPATFCQHLGLSYCCVLHCAKIQIGRPFGGFFSIWQGLKRIRALHFAGFVALPA